MRKVFTLAAAMLFAGALSGYAEKSNFVPRGWDGSAYTYPYQSFQSEVTRAADGSYVIEDFFNSGESLSFTFEEAIDDYTEMVITNPLDDTYTYPFLMTQDEEYMQLKAYDSDSDEEVAIYFPYVALGRSYTWVYSYDTEDGFFDPEYDHAYMGQICMAGTLADNTSTPWLYIYFYFDKQDIPTAITTVGSDENAPVEYFNLQGVKVDNPEHGIYIRRQGNKTTKVKL